MDQTLPLSQKLYLLGIHPEKGGIVSASYSAMNYIMAGSMLLELHQNGNVKFENKRIKLINSKTENATHQFMLLKIAAAKSPRRISHWINKFAFSNKLIYKGVQNGLVGKRIIRMKSKHFLFIKWKSPVIVNKSTVYHLVDDVREFINKGTTVENELILLSFILPGKLQYRLYKDRRKRKDAQKRLKSLLIENPVSKSVKEAIEAAEAVAAMTVVTTST